MSSLRLDELDAVELAACAELGRERVEGMTASRYGGLCAWMNEHDDDKANNRKRVSMYCGASVKIAIEIKTYEHTETFRSEHFACCR